MVDTGIRVGRRFILIKTFAFVSRACACQWRFFLLMAFLTLNLEIGQPTGLLFILEAGRGSIVFCNCLNRLIQFDLARALSC